MKILLATHNLNKVIEIKEHLKKHLEIEVLTLNDLQITEEPEETETTFAGNAQIKAQWGAEKSGLVTLADDSGLEIDALNKEPGVNSARYLGKETSYDFKNDFILKGLKQSTERSARFISVVAIAFPKNDKLDLGNTDIILCEGIMEGSIAYEPKGKSGFGYDPIFIPLGMTETFAQMTLETKNKISHRGQALRKAVTVLTQGEQK